MKRIFVTGTAGFIGFHLARVLLEEGFVVHGYDGMTDYYDVSLKKARHEILRKHKNFTATEGMLEDFGSLTKAADACQPDIIVHLAAQAGVRYSIENPRSYLESNVGHIQRYRNCARTFCKTFAYGLNLLGLWGKYGDAL